MIICTEQELGIIGFGVSVGVDNKNSKILIFERFGHCKDFYRIFP